jgi:zinc/manganese transport system substrate-binding protein
MLQLLSLLAFFCSLLAAAPALADLKVVATTPDLAAIAQDVGGDRATVSALALPTQDPHFVDARPHLALELARADLLVVVGLGLEVGWLPTLQTGSRNGAIQVGGPGYLDCSTVVHLLEVPAGPVDRSMGDVHPGGNPHYMRDPRAAVPVAIAIAKRMGELDPKNAPVFAANAKRFEDRVMEARRRWEAALAPLRAAKVVAYHRSMAYVADWLGLAVVEHVEPRPGIPPSPGHVAHVLAVAQERGVKLLLQEQYYPDGVSGLIAQRAGIRLVKLPGGPDFRAKQSYFDYVDALVRALSGTAK